MRRTVVLCILMLLAVAPAAAAHTSTMVTEPSTFETIGGEPVEISMHGDRIPPGSDEQLMQRSRVVARVSAAALAGTWCGTERQTDDTTNASHQGARIKVVYAYAYDQPNRFAEYADLIQSDVATVAQWVADSTGGQRTIRFDTGTHCGPDYVDIATVRLPRARSSYTGSPSRANYVIDDIDEMPLGLSGPRNILVYADGLYANDGVVGTAQLPNDDSSSFHNVTNVGGNTAMIWGDGGSDFSEDRLTTFLHEVSHNLGAVQDSAPNSTGAGHCFEMWDVMCYADGGPRGSIDDLVGNCPMSPLLPFECGDDDYFNPSPSAGSYLATHWNVYNSAFLCYVSSCVIPKGTTPPPPPTPTPTPTPQPTPTPDPGAVPPPAPAPDPGVAVGEDAQLWLDGFMTTAVGSLRKVGLRGLASGKAVVFEGQAPNGHAVQVDLMLGAAAIAGGPLDTAGKARLKVPRVHRLALARMRKVRLTLQGVIRGAAGGGPPTVKRVTVTLKQTIKKKRRRR